MISQASTHLEPIRSELQFVNPKHETFQPSVCLPIFTNVFVKSLNAYLVNTGRFTISGKHWAIILCIFTSYRYIFTMNTYYSNLPHWPFLSQLVISKDFRWLFWIHNLCGCENEKVCGHSIGIVWKSCIIPNVIFTLFLKIPFHPSHTNSIIFLLFLYFNAC